MSLGIAFKGTDGIVLAADSRVTLTAEIQQPVPAGAPAKPPQIVPAHYDNATKLLRVQGQDFVGAVTYGVGAIGSPPRTAHSFLPEFESELANQKTQRLSVENFAKALSDFFLKQWTAQKMPVPTSVGDMVFFVGGYDDGEPYGRLFEIYIPSKPIPVERHNADFGMIWGGQREITDRLITGFDPTLISSATDFLKLLPAQVSALIAHLQQHQAPIPFAFLPLQDCVNLLILLLRTTIALQQFQVGIRGVGGAIDLVTITRIDGLKNIQVKSITGEFQ